MNINLPRNLRAAASASALGIGAIILAWAVSAEGEAPGLALTSHPRAVSIPKMPAKTLASNSEAIIARPLFQETRKPAPPKPAAASPVQQEAAPPAPLLATLVGVIVSPDVKSAIMRLASGKSVAVTEGETLEGWQLKRVTPDSAQFQQRSATTELTFPVLQASADPTSPAMGLGAPARRRR
jgi:hypothetical protein